MTGIAFMVTQDMKQRLRDLGYSNEEIAQLTPEQAHKILTADGATMEETINHELEVAEQELRQQERGKANGSGQTGPLIQSSAQFVKDFRPPDYLIDGVLQRRFLYACTGKTGSGKTAVVLLFAASVALGKAIGTLEVAQGRVLYFAGENADDVRARWIAMGQHHDFDVDTTEVHFIPRRFKIFALRKRILQELATIGDVALVIVDTSAAYFPGDDINNNVQALAHAHTLRSLVDLPGGPCVLVNCHPVKHATADNLIPVGGGAFLNEIDGNLTCAISDNLTEVHWLGKFRGPDFAPLAFKLQTITDDRLKDSKGRLMPTVVASYLSELEQQKIKQTERSNEDKLLLVIKTNGKASLADYARVCEWVTRAGEPYKMLVSRTAERLIKFKLITKDRDGYTITEKGTKAIKELEADEREGKRPDVTVTMASKAKKPNPKIRIEGGAPATEGTPCAHCHGTNGPVLLLRNAVVIGSLERWPLHKDCAEAFFRWIATGEKQPKKP